MPIPTSVRSLSAALLVAVLLTGCSNPGTKRGATPSSTVSASADQQIRNAALQRRLDGLERQYGARIGAAVLDTATGRQVLHDGAARFAFASTNKVFIAAATLQSASNADLETVVHYSKDDLLDYAPVTSQHADAGMTVRELIDAAVRYSDNTAANLLVKRLGGPDTVEQYLRSLGDRTTTVDRVEPDLNTAVPGDRRDTTTPAAFAHDLQQVLLRSALPTGDRALLRDAMRRNTTGAPYIRAGLPTSWTVADKTGAGAYGVRNDIALVTPPGRAPVIIVLLTNRKSEDADSQDALIADATRAIADDLR